MLPSIAAALGTHLIGITIASAAGRQAGKKSGNLCVQRCVEAMLEPKSVLKGAVLRHLVVPGLVLLLGLGSAFAQSGDNHAQDQSGKPAAATPSDAAKENQRKVDQFGEAAQAINGPAGNPECVWLGRRVVQLVWVDDLDTAFRHLDLYDRFGCPGGHIQAAFRCLTRFGAQIDDKVPRSLSDHVHGCWINPAAQPPQPQQAATPAAAPAPTTAGSASPAPAAPQPAPSALPSPQPPAK
jgi:pyruvate/2-oxoglutarate dehydrogenase complex dihydrolipoamide acyltransferase (E2) component